MIADVGFFLRLWKKFFSDFLEIELFSKQILFISATSRWYFLWYVFFLSVDCTATGLFPPWKQWISMLRGKSVRTQSPAEHRESAQLWLPNYILVCVYNLKISSKYRLHWEGKKNHKFLKYIHVLVWWTHLVLS